MVTKLKENWRRGLISLFILFHLYIMVFWGLPGSAFRYVMVKPITPYVVTTGLWHSWDMFSPDPLAVNFNLEAQILYQNGLTRTWTFPRMDKLGYWDRFQMERYRKWRERVRMDIYSVVWDDTARYIARLNDTATNHPVRVTLVRQWQPIPAPLMEPGKPELENRQPMVRELSFPFSYRFKTYDLKRGDL